MLGSTLLRSPATSSAALVGPSMARGHRSERKLPIVVRCVREYPPFPKVLKPLGRPTLLEQFVDSLPLVERTKYKLTYYCTTVEGDECCSCWDAYFEMKDLEEKMPAEELNNLLQRASNEGMKWLIRSLHRAARLQKESGDEIQERAKESGERHIGLPKHVLESRTIEVEEPPRHVPDGLPKTQEEIEEEEKDLMPESDFTRLIKALHVYPSWYRERPDVECY